MPICISYNNSDMIILLAERKRERVSRAFTIRTEIASVCANGDDKRKGKLQDKAISITNIQTYIYIYMYK